MPGPCVSWGFPLSLRCKLATRTAQCIGSLSCWGLRDGGQALSPDTKWGCPGPGPRSRERSCVGNADLQPWHHLSPWELFHLRERCRTVPEDDRHGTAPRAVGSAPHCWSSGGIRALLSDVRFRFGWCCVEQELDSIIPFQLGMFCDSTVVLLSKTDTLGWASWHCVIASPSFAKERSSNVSKELCSQKDGTMHSAGGEE